MSMLMFVRRLHQGICCADAGTIDSLEVNLPSGKAEQLQLID